MMSTKRGMIFVVVALFFTLFSFSASAERCLVFPEGGVSHYCVPYTPEMQEYCDRDAVCDERVHVSVSSCSELDICEPVICNVFTEGIAPTTSSLSEGCHDQIPRGFCELQERSTIVSEDDRDNWCTPGCCRLSNAGFCGYGPELNRYQCQQMAVNRGLVVENFDSRAGMNAETCNQEYCLLEAPQSASVHGVVSGENGQPLAGARIQVRNTNIEMVTPADGIYSFLGLSAGTQVLDVTAAGYRSSSQSINLNAGTDREVNIILVLGVTGGTVSGTIRSAETSATLAGATVTWAGLSRGSATSDGLGKFSTPLLPSGSYRFSVSKTGFQSLERTITVGTSNLEGVDFALAAVTTHGIRGTTSLERGGVLVPASGVQLYVDGIFKGYSLPPNQFEITTSSGNHVLSARYQNFEFRGPVTVPTLGFVTQDLILTIPSGECTADGPTPHKNVAGFQALPVVGVKVVNLIWTKPCAEVVRYLITRTDALGNTKQIQASLADLSLLDSEVEWDSSYTYSIVAFYSSGFSSAEPAVVSIRTGDKECEGRYHSSGWESFCRVQDPQRVFTCDNNNKVIPTNLNCAERGTGRDYFCAQISDIAAECKSIGTCAVLGTPFGLYSTRESCYGSDAPERGRASTFCTYDYTNRTIADQCLACTTLRSCFDYKSKDACEVDSCSLGKPSCQWTDGAQTITTSTVDYSSLFPGLSIPSRVRVETGSGYCVEQNYPEDDRCSLCGSSSESTFFENYFCTADVCSGLGRCFSNPYYQGQDKALSTCFSCGDFPSEDRTCYSYNTRQECTGGQDFQKQSSGQFVYSQDQCGWQRCSWAVDARGVGQCFKDGDGNRDNDCGGFEGAERTACAQDIAPPHTTIAEEESYILSLSHPSLRFHASDVQLQKLRQTNKLRSLWYCLTPADPSVSDQCITRDGRDPFLEAAYPGVSDTESVPVNLLAHLGRESNGRTYRLKYYSKDKYYNQEEVQETFVYVDDVPPQFELGESITTTADMTNLVVYLQGPSEPMDCILSVTQEIPPGSTRQQVIGRNTTRKEAAFNDLPGVGHLLNATCFDLAGNWQEVLKRYTFDLQENIDIIYPALRSGVALSSIEFKIHTDVGATCGLYYVPTGELVADFITDEIGKEHRTPLIAGSSGAGFVEGEYAQKYKAVCKEFHTNKIFEDYFHFFVDFTPPEVSIMLREGQREERPQGRGWQKYFVQSATAEFECDAGEGLACDKIFYCLGENCALVRNNPDYREYTSSIELTNSTHICYYAQDVANRPVFPLCGEVFIEGYGITLVHPSPRYYGGEVWGISNAANFTWEFYTKVPTARCAFDFVPGFDFEEVPNFKILNPLGDGSYLFRNFPQSAGTSAYPVSGGVKTVYVQCENAQGEIGPEQKINLEYDPSAPQVTSFFAEPNPLIEGNKDILTAETDDKTSCKYSDSGHTEYALMPFAFPGAESEVMGHVPATPVLDTRHIAEYRVGGFIGLVRDFNFTMQCKNGAGDLSEAESLILHIDYAQQGGITSIFPNGDYFPVTNVTLRVETSKNALCTFTANNATVHMRGAGGRVHTSTLSNLREGNYQYPLSCTIGDNRAEGVIRFAIDLTKPVVSRIDDGAYSCGSDALQVMVYSNEANVSAYYYEVYRLPGQGTGQGGSGVVVGTSTSTGSRNNSRNASLNLTNSSAVGSGSSVNTLSPKTLVLNGTTTPELPIHIPASSLQQGMRYSVKVKIRDRAGWLGEFAESDGVLITNTSMASCVNNSGAPLVQDVVNESSCTSLALELHCEDEQGCRQLKYGISPSASSCVAGQPYTQRISLDQNSWLCYYVEDNTGKNYSALKQILYPDEDGDGVLNSCDVCEDTAAGKVTDQKGCASGQVPRMEEEIDFDQDGLPDYWEQQYNGLNCAFDYLAPDSDADTIDDPEENYDLDGAANYDEFVANTDPCFITDEPAPRNQTKGPIPTLVPPEVPSSKLLAWVLLFLGLFLVSGGVTYLMYYAQRSSHGAPLTVGARRFPSTGVSLQGGVSSTPTPTEGISLKSLGQNLGQSLGSIFRGRSRQERQQLRERQEVFGRFSKGFSKDSENIPHIDEVLRKKSAHLPKLQELAQRYVDHKDEIKPGLKSEEKSVFIKLEGIAKKVQESDIEEVVSTREAKDIFSQLKRISDKRKGRGK